MKLLKKLIRKSLFKKIFALHSKLQKGFGDKDAFTEGQIKRVYTDAKLPLEHIIFAFALYMDKESFDLTQSEAKTVISYDSLRGEVSEVLFSGESFLVGTEGVSDDFERLPKHHQLWHPSGGVGGI